jgi:hypothetical protein
VDDGFLVFGTVDFGDKYIFIAKFSLTGAHVLTKFYGHQDFEIQATASASDGGFFFVANNDTSGMIGKIKSE